MEKRTVQFTIPKGGGIKIEAMEMQGEACTIITKDIELHLARNSQVVDEGKKSEYYEPGPDVSVFNDLN